MTTESLNWNDIALPEEVRAAVDTLAAAYHQKLEANLIGLILYGSAARGHYRAGKSDVNLLVVLDQADTHALTPVLDAVLTARRHNVAPLHMTPGDLKSFTRVFPIKFLAFRESYKLLWGLDALASLEVEDANLRLRCQQEMQNLLMRLRRHFVTRQGHSLNPMVRETMNGFMETLRRVVQLAESEVPKRSELAERAAQTIGFDQKKLETLMALKNPSGNENPEISHELYNDFMQIIEQTARFTEKLETR